MKKVVLVLLVFLSVQSLFSQTSPQISAIDRVRLAEAFRLGDKFSEKVWKNWSKTPFAVLLITRENEFLIRHPQPSKDFIEIGYDKMLQSKVYRRKRNFNSEFLATFPAVPGSSVSTIVVGQAENTFVKTSTPWVVTILHEHFHQMQDSQPNMYQASLDLGISGGDQTGMWMLNYPFPYADKAVTQSFGELAKQLAKTLETEKSADFQNELKIYLKMRAEFNKSLKPNDYKYLSFQLWKEGTARYAEYQIAKLAAQNYQPSKEFKALKDFKPYLQVAATMRKNIIGQLKSIDLSNSQREVAYPFGAGEALLLDKAEIEWKSRYFDDKFFPDKYFEKIMIEEKLRKIASEHPFPLVFATISGAHLYGFPSPDSDYDLRGVHVLPIREIVGLDAGEETIQVEELRDDLELDLVTHDSKKFFNLMLRKNGYVLEQLYSPLIVQTSPEHDELKAIGKNCITKYHAHHYFGFAKTEWKLFEKEKPHRVKPLLYIFRVLLTGIYLMQTGEIEANLNKLNEGFRISYIPELIERKVKGKEKGILPDADLNFYQNEYQRLVGELEKAQEISNLPEKPTAKDSLNDLLIRLRLK